MSRLIGQRLAVCLTLAAAGLSPVGAGAQEASPQEVAALREALRQQQQRYEALAQRMEKLEAQNPGATDADAAAERLDALEEMLFDLDERVGSRGLVRAFDALSIDLGGFLTQQFTFASGEGSSEASFNATQFELLIGADVTENFSMFAALGFLREADLSFADPTNPTFLGFANRTPNIISWANYRVSDKLEVRAGRYVTPMGIINIEHFPPVLLDVNQPQFLRPFSGSTIFPNFLTGAEVHGKFFLGESGGDVLSYRVFAGAFNGGANADHVNAGGRLQYRFGDSGFTAGVNYMHGRRAGGATVATPLGNFSVTPAISFVSTDHDVFGADLLYDKGRVLWKTEAFFSSEKEGGDRLAFYTQPAYRLSDRWIVFYRFDYLDPGQGLSESTEHMAGVNFLPVPTVRLRGVYILKHFNASDEDVNIFQLSATFSF